mgnify:CR=1 FL=1
MTQQRVLIAERLEPTLAEAVCECERDRTFILTDENTEEQCLPLVSDFDCLKDARTIVIKSSDSNKNLDSLSHVWEELGKGGATRHTLLINLGGGMVTDLGGFAASTFKRGINYINIPTTLLAMVDASVGGKTGINFRGLKNEIGVFNNASSVILHTPFLRTLDRENILSGYAEMIKHGLISNSEMWAELMNFDIEQPDLSALQKMLTDSVAVKQRIVTEDPTEQGIRKALNLGHTIGHAFESMSMLLSGDSTSPSAATKPILHGYAVAYGLICELYLSAVKTGFPTDKMHQTVSFIKEHYNKMTITCDDYPWLLELMTHDKKNVAGVINFTLLSAIGGIEINQTATKKEIEEALDFFREG